MSGVDWPTRISGTCPDCESTTTVEHPDGLGGVGLPWRCPVCLHAVEMTEADA